jgi:hypothetical protein
MTTANRPTRRRATSDQEVLAAVVELVDDGFCPRGELVRRLGAGEREARRAIGRAARRGLLLQRLGLDGLSHLAVSQEGWDLLRAEQAAPA